MVGRRSIVRPGVRQAEICDLVARFEEVSVKTLAAKYTTSEETIRRDLSLLADAGRVQKVHGGARRVARIDEGAFDERMGQNLLAKRLIAEKVAKLVAPRQTIFMDTGSTTLICAEAMARTKSLTVITNSARISATFAAGTGGAQVFLLGGLFRGDNAQTVGPTTIREIGYYRTDHAIITAGTLRAEGAYDYSYSEAQVARAMIAAASEITVVVDHSKFERDATHKLCNLDQIDNLISDKRPNDALADALHRANVAQL